MAVSPEEARHRAAAYVDAWSGSKDRWSLAGRLFVLQVVALLVVLVPVWLSAVGQARESARAEAVSTARAVATTLAESDWLREAVLGDDPAGELAEPVEQIRVADGMGFIVVMDPSGIRYTHPEEEAVGEPFIGDISAARDGGVVVDDDTGTLGPSVRVVVPVKDDGAVVALVAVGVPLSSIADVARSAAVRFGAIGGLSLLVGGIGVVLSSRWLARRTYGLGPVGLARLHGYHDAVLHSVRTGIVLIGEDGTVLLCNDEARRLLDAADASPGTRIDRIGADAGVAELLASGREVHGEAIPTPARTLVVSQLPATHDGRVLGWVTTLSDRTDLVRLSGELDSLRSFTEALRSRVHEADNRLHTTAMLVEIGEYEQAVTFATSELERWRDLADSVSESIEEPAVAALVLGKAAQAQERGVRLEVAPGTRIPRTRIDTGDLITILGNLVDNAIDASSSAPSPRTVRVEGGVAEGMLVLQVADSGPGLSREEAEQAFVRGWSTKEVPDAADRPQGRGIGLALVDSAVRRHGGSIEVLNTPESLFRVRLPSSVAFGPSEERKTR